MRVLELSQRYPPAIGGVEATLEELVSGLRAAQVEVQVLTTDLVRNTPFARGAPPWPPSAVRVRRCRAVRVMPLPLGLGVIAPGMLRAAAADDADVLHAHAFGYYPTWVGAWVRRTRGTPLVITTHADPGRGLTFSRTYHRVVASGTLRAADRIVVQSRVEREFLGSLGIPSARLVTIPTGVRLDEFPPPPSVRADGSPRLLTVGRFDLEQKGLGTLVRALARLPTSLPFRAEALGDDWGGREPAQALAAQLGVADRLTLRTGLPRGEVLAAYGAADLFVLPSRFESFPRVLLEAMASGLPIVATRVGGVAELVREGENALLVPPDDPAALAAAIERMLRDDALRTRFGRSSRERARAFGWDAIIPRYVEMFRELAEERPRASLRA